MEVLAVSAEIHKAKVIIANVYIPPASSCDPAPYKPDFSKVLDIAGDGDALILGDLNAHHASWHSPNDCPRGIDFNDAIEASNLVALNGDAPTRMCRGNPLSSPDVSLVASTLALDYTWEISTTLNSDHRPIIISPVDVSSPFFDDSSERTFTNFKRADWSNFHKETEAAFSSLRLPTKCGEGERIEIEQLLRRVGAPQGLLHVPVDNPLARKNYSEILKSSL